MVEHFKEFSRFNS